MLILSEPRQRADTLILTEQLSPFSWVLVWIPVSYRRTLSMQPSVLYRFFYICRLLPLPPYFKNN